MRYALFAGEDYYPSGGWGDHVVTCETVEAAKTRRPRNSVNWAHIVDLETGERILGWDDSVRGWWPPDVLAEKMDAAWSSSPRPYAFAGSVAGFALAPTQAVISPVPTQSTSVVATSAEKLGL